MSPEDISTNDGPTHNDNHSNNSASRRPAVGSPVKAAREKQGRNKSPKKHSRYDELHRRVDRQSASLAEAETTILYLKEENELLKKKLKQSKNITGELVCCTTYYSEKAMKLKNILYPKPPSSGIELKGGFQRLDELQRERQRVLVAPRKLKQLTSSVYSGVEQTFGVKDLLALLEREISKVERDVGQTEMARIVRGAQCRTWLHWRLLTKSAILVQKILRGNNVRKLMWD